MWNLSVIVKGFQRVGYIAAHGLQQWGLPATATESLHEK
jgi:hypothetical protein